jgi:solute carrier family 66, member 2
MAPPWLSSLASIGMAIGPPLVYLDQTVSIIKKKYASSLAARILCSLLPIILETLLVFLETFVQFCEHI